MTSQTRCIKVITVLLSIAILLVTIIANPTLVRAQNEGPNKINISVPHKMGVKIISPSKAVVVVIVARSQNQRSRLYT
jgi:hypothetical protein